MNYHPKYLHCFQQTHYYLMHDDGPLPFDYRHYIAIMVSSHCIDAKLIADSQLAVLLDLVYVHTVLNASRIFSSVCMIIAQQLYGY